MNILFHEYQLLTSNLFFTINLFFIIIIVFVERKSPASTITWVIFLFLFPILGFVFYMLLGRKPRIEKKVLSKFQSDKFNITKFQNLIDKYVATSRKKIGNSKYKSIINLNLNSSEYNYTDNNDVKIYIRGKDKFNDFIESIENAEKFIHLEYYIIRNDNIGKKIIGILEEKAKEGLDIKIICDAVGSFGVSFSLFHNLIKNGGMVTKFSPSIISFLNHRNHRKIAVIDGQEAFVGGFNIGDEYLGKTKEYGFWRDTHLRVKGESVNYLEMQFLLDWVFSKKTDASELLNTTYFPTKGQYKNISIQIVSSGPDSEWKSLKLGYIKMINSAKKSIYIQTPYFIPDSSVLDSLKIAALSGIDVRVMIPKKPDHAFIQAASIYHIGELLPSGVRCFLYKKGFLHSKTIVVDGEISAIGSANIDIRSFELNFEISAFIYNEEISKQNKDIFMSDLNFCEEFTYYDYIKRSALSKMSESILRLFSPLF